MADDQQQEKTEHASLKRREDFRKKGQVAQSREVHTAALLTATLVLWIFYAPAFWRGLQNLTRGFFSQAGSLEVTPQSVQNLGAFVVGEVGLLLAPVLILVLVVGFFSSVLQIGFLVTGEPLKPDFSRLDPVKGMGRFFSRRSLVEVVKSLAKVLLIGTVAYRTVKAEFAGDLVLVDLDVAQTLAYLGKVAALVLFKTCGLLVALAVLDFFFVRWELEQKMKMTRQDQKEEYKETEGDPYLKSRIRSLQAQMARRRMMSEVPKADVVITNPTHLSIAISYRREKMAAPQIVAKGADHLALRIREIARESGVPMVENVPVARALYRSEVGEAVPEELYKAVAEVLAYVYSLKGVKR